MAVLVLQVYSRGKMAELNVPIYDFRHGVLTPKLKDRPNLDLYKSGVLVGENFLTQLHGPTSYRPGFEHSRTTRRNNVAHFIPFTFADDEAYVLSFTEGYMRIFTDGGVVTEDPLSISGITQADPGEITVVGNDYEDGDEIYIDGCIGMTDLNGQFFLVAGTVTPGTSERNWPYSVPGNYTYNASDIEVSAGNAHLKVGGSTTDFPFTTPANYIYPAGIQVAAGVADLVDLVPANATFYANYISDINGTWGGGVLTGVATGGAAVSGGELDLIYSDTRYVTYDADGNADSQQVGCVRFLVRPNYNGSPATNGIFVSISKASGDTDNLVQLQHQSTGDFRVLVYDFTGAVIFAQNTVWSPTSGVQYEIEFNWDITTGASRLFVDGVQLGATNISTGIRDALIGQFRLGNNTSGSATANFTLDDVLIFSTVQHTANYAPGAAIPQTKYGIDDPTIVNNTGLVFASAFNAFVETATEVGSNIRYQLSSDDGATWKWWSGAAWTARTGGQTDSWYYTNEATDNVSVNINIAALAASGTFKFQAFLHSDTGAETPVLDLVQIGNITYPLTDPTIESDDGFPFIAALEDFTETSTKPGTTEIQYIVSIDDGGSYLYWSGAAWVASNETYAQSNTAAVVDTNIAALGASGTFKYKAFLHTSDISMTPELDNIHTQFTVLPSDTFNITDQDGNPIDTSGFDAYTGSGTAARVYEINSPYLENDLPQLKFAQKADIMYIDHPSYAPRKLIRFGDGTWTLAPYSRINDPFGQVDITNITQANPGVVTTGTDHGFVDDDLVLIENVAGMLQVNHVVFTITRITDTTFSIGVNTTAYTAYDSGGVTLLNGAAPAAVGFYGGRVFHGGSVLDPDFIFGSRSPDPTDGSTRYENFTLGSDPDNGVSYALTSASTSSVDRVRFFMGTRQFLAVGTYAGMLKVNGGSDSDPISGIAVESFPVDNYGVADIMPINFGTDIIYVQRGGEVVYSFKYTLLSDGWKSEDETLQSDEITTNGIKQLAYQQGNPNQVWCAMEDGRLLSFVYSDVEGISAWNEHLMGGDGIVLTVAAQPQDDNRDRVWIAVERVINGITRRYVEYQAKNPRIPEREDFYTGTNTTAKEADTSKYQNLLFYAQKRQIHLDSELALDTTQTATITPAAVSGDNVAFTASESIFAAGDLRRRIQIKYLTGTEQGIAEIIEYVSETEVNCLILQEFESTDPLTSGEWYFTQDTVQGLGHLEGETVGVVADGGTHPNRTVVDGEITLVGQATYVLIGLLYYGRLKTMPLELLLTTGITPGKLKSVNKVNLMFRNTLGVSYGTDPYNMQQIGFRSGPQFTDRPPFLYNGVKEQPGFDKFDEQRYMWIVQTLPYPCTLNAMVFDMEFSQEN